MYYLMFMPVVLVCISLLVGWRRRFVGIVVHAVGIVAAVLGNIRSRAATRVGVFRRGGCHRYDYWCHHGCMQHGACCMLLVLLLFDVAVDCIWCKGFRGCRHRQCLAHILVHSALHTGVLSMQHTMRIRQNIRFACALRSDFFVEPALVHHSPRHPRTPSSIPPHTLRCPPPSATARTTPLLPPAPVAGSPPSPRPSTIHLTPSFSGMMMLCIFGIADGVD
jgi:hypothetical protein